MKWPKITRDLVLFTAGLALFVHEAVIRVGPERPTFILAYMAMMGLPAILRADELRKRIENGNGNGKEGDKK